MGASSYTEAEARLTERLAQGGFRFTPHRQHVYQVLLGHRDHPTADEVYLRSKQTMPEISMATVYNCLDALVRCGLVRQVNLDGTAKHYCPNMHEHFHFRCDVCGGIYDIEVSSELLARSAVPAGYRVSHVEVAMRGTCPTCGGSGAAATSRLTPSA